MYGVVILYTLNNNSMLPRTHFGQHLDKNRAIHIYDDNPTCVVYFSDSYSNISGLHEDA